MAKKTKKPSREEIYRGVVTNYDELHPLMIKFEDERHQHAFHFDLMNDKISYSLYDGVGNAAIVLFNADADMNRVDELVLGNLGTSHKPNLKMITEFFG